MHLTLILKYCILHFTSSYLKFCIPHFTNSYLAVLHITQLDLVPFNRYLLQGLSWVYSVLNCCVVTSLLFATQDKILA